MPFGNPLSTLMGVRVIVNPLAERHWTEFKVERHPIQKRRRRWRVRSIKHVELCAYRLANGSLVVHPAIAAKLRAAAGE